MTAYRKNVSAAIDFSMVTTAGIADPTGTGLVANRIIDNGGLTSCVGNIINKTQGAWTLVMDSSDCNGNTVGLYLTAPGDAPLMLTFPTTTANPQDAVRFGLSALPNFSPGVAGGVAIAGSNAPTTFGAFSVTGLTTHTGPTNYTGNMLFSDGITIPAPSTTNRAGVDVTGNGTADGIIVNGGSGAGTAGIRLIGTSYSLYAVNPVTFSDTVNFIQAVTMSAGLVANITGNLSGSVGSVAAGGIGSTAFTTAALQAIADTWLDRNMATGVDSGNNTVRTPRQALRTLRNKVDVPGGTVYKEDDTTASYTFSVTTAAGNPITVFDPT